MFACREQASRNLFVTDTLNHPVRKIDRDGNVTTVAGDLQAGWSDGTGTGARLSYTGGIAVGPDGKLVVSDREGHRIRLIE